MSLALLVLGLAALVGGAELLVGGASRLARGLGVSALMVGLTVVSLGTSAPEVAVSLQGAVVGAGDIAVGNIVGSNACNVLLILGLSAAITPLLVDAKLVKVDVPVMIGASLLFALLVADGRLGWIDGALLLASLAAYLGVLIRAGRRAGPESRSSRVPLTARSLARDIGAIGLGLVLLVLGARWLVQTAVELARTLGVSELVIGLTVVAVGTSLPELATSVLASLRGERDLAVGNVVGSNIFNILFVLGAVGVVAPGGTAIPTSVRLFDLPVVIAAAIACLPIVFTGSRIDRWEGVLLVGFFFAYLACVVLRAVESPVRGTVELALGGIVLPLVFLTLAVIAARELRARRRQRRAADRDGAATPDDRG